MANELLIKQTMSVFEKITVKLINPAFKFSKGGATIRTVREALERLEKKYGSLSRERIVDYCVCSAYAFKTRGNAWTIKQALGPKSLERFNTNQGRRYYEDRWLTTANLTRADLMSLIQDKSNHPLADYVYMPMEESTKSRLINTLEGFMICQQSTLGWSPESETCMMCNYKDDCKNETQKKFPEIFRLRMEYGKK